MQWISEQSLCIKRPLIEFHCEYCSIKVIEPNAFNNAKTLDNLILSNSEIADLPKRLFEQATSLLTLNLGSNHIAHFNASDLHLRFLNSLDLGCNRLTSLDLQKSNIISIGLENNRIRKIDANMFGRKHFIGQLSMENNRIRERSQTAFKRVKFISALKLQGNKLKTFLNHFSMILLLACCSCTIIDFQT